MIFVIIASRRNSGEVSVAVAFIGTFHRVRTGAGQVVSANQRDSRFCGNAPTISEHPRTAWPKKLNTLT
ncbi:MAG: hypothetical protein ACRDSZ_02305 [Pseudonocardiaceae bacterium]